MRLTFDEYISMKFPQNSWAERAHMLCCGAGLSGNLVEKEKDYEIKNFEKYCSENGLIPIY